MKEIILVLEEAGEGGFVARALGTSIVTEADAPKVIRLHFVRDQVIPA